MAETMSIPTSTLAPVQALSGSTCEEAIDLVEKVGGDETNRNSTPKGWSAQLPWGGNAGEEAGTEKENDTDKEAGTASLSSGADTDSDGPTSSELASGSTQRRVEAAAQAVHDSEEKLEHDVTSSLAPRESGADIQSVGIERGSVPLPLSTRTPPPCPSESESLKTPPGLDLPPMSTVSLLSPSTSSGAGGLYNEPALPLENVHNEAGNVLSSPTAFSSISLSHTDHELPSECQEIGYQQGEYQQQVDYQQEYAQEYQQQQQHPEYQQQSAYQPQPQPQSFEPLPPSQLLSATISQALSFTPHSQAPHSPSTALRHQHQQRQQAYFNFSYKPSSRDVISGIAPHVFDERRRRRSASKGRRNSGRWLHRNNGAYDSGYGAVAGVGSPRASPLRRSVVVSWDERSIYLEEATCTGAITSRVSIDIATGHERRDLSDDSSSSSGSSGEGSCSPTSSASSSKSSGTMEKGLFGKRGGKAGASGKAGATGPRWSRKFKLFKNIVSRMKKREATTPPAQAASGEAH